MDWHESNSVTVFRAEQMDVNRALFRELSPIDHIQPVFLRQYAYYTNAAHTMATGWLRRYGQYRHCSRPVAHARYLNTK